MDENIRQRRQNAINTIDQHANTLRENGMNPYEVQKMHSAARREVADALPDTLKYQQATNLATQYIQKKAA